VDESTYNGLVAAAFKRLLTGLDKLDPDLVDVTATADMLTVTDVKSGEKVVVNTQRAVWQIWVAGKSQGIHFSHAADGRWVDDKGKGLELFAWVAECVGVMCGERLQL
jgi:CyaY protein